MFKNREFRIRVAKTEDAPTEPQPVPHNISKEDIYEVMKNATVCVISVAGALTLMRVASEIAIHHGTKS